MKTSEVLKHAKQRLAEKHTDRYDSSREGRDKFICIAIMNAERNVKHITVEDARRCKKMIESRLEGNDTLEGWLCSKNCLPDDGWTDEHKDRIQQHRHAWLDMLIAEFEAKGD